MVYDIVDSDNIEYFKEDYLNMLKNMYNQPLKIYDEDIENLKFGYTNRELTQQMLKTALERGEITIHQFIKIIMNK